MKVIPGVRSRSDDAQARIAIDRWHNEGGRVHDAEQPAKVRPPRLIRPRSARRARLDVAAPMTEHVQRPDSGPAVDSAPSATTPRSVNGSGEERPAGRGVQHPATTADR